MIQEFFWPDEFEAHVESLRAQGLLNKTALTLEKRLMGIPAILAILISALLFAESAPAYAYVLLCLGALLFYLYLVYDYPVDRIIPYTLGKEARTSQYKLSYNIGGRTSISGWQLRYTYVGKKKRFLPLKENEKMFINSQKDSIRILINPYNKAHSCPYFPSWPSKFSLKTPEQNT